MKALEKNEANRWSYMTVEQLERRLDKITNPDKLRLFAKYASLYGQRALLIEANKKIRFFKAHGVN